MIRLFFDPLRFLSQLDHKREIKLEIYPYKNVNFLCQFLFVPFYHIRYFQSLEASNLSLNLRNTTEILVELFL